MRDDRSRDLIAAYVVLSIITVASPWIGRGAQ